jgi:hypothetical protein
MKQSLLLENNANTIVKKTHNGLKAVCTLCEAFQ